MTEHLQFHLLETEVLKIIGEYVNHTLFKQPVTLTSIEREPESNTFEFVAIAATKEPRVSKPRKARGAATGRRGLKEPVLREQAPVLGEQAQQPNGAEQQL